MQPKQPVVLVVLVEAARLRWFVAAVRFDSTVAPLLRSEEGDLATYQGLDFDNQVSFLRHRFCGIVQRGCDRLWPRGEKACQFVFLFQGTLPGTAAELMQRVSDHFVEWMLNPPVVVFTSADDAAGPGPLRVSQLAGTVTPPVEELLHATLARVLATAATPEVWELSQRKSTWHPDEGG